MSLYDDELDAESSRLSIKSLLLGAIGFAAVFGYLFWLFLVRAYVIEVMPQEAKDTAFFATTAGSSFILSNRVYTLGGAVSIQVAAPNFKAQALEINEQSTTNLTVTLQPVPTEAQPIELQEFPVQSTVNSTPADAQLKENNPTPKPAAKPADETQAVAIKQTEAQAVPAEPDKPMAEQLGFKFVRLNMSNFTMGSPANQIGRYRNEFEYQVSFDKTVLIAKHEVTESQYSAFKPSVAKTDLPVTNVSWDDAALYANWLSEQDGLELFYRVVDGQVRGFNRTAKGYRLISEAEWEWLAKQSSRAAPTLYVWGNQDQVPNNFANYGAITGHEDKHASKAPVGSYPAERMGIFDLSGNVSEWVNDVHEFAAPTGNTVDYLGPSSGSSYVIKGGHYNTSRLPSLRPAFREYGSAGQATVGFRLARYE